MHLAVDAQEYPSTLLASYFRLFSVLFVVPFRIHISSDDKKIHVVVRKAFGKLACIAVQLSALAFITVTTYYHVYFYIRSHSNITWAVVSLMSNLLETCLFYQTFIIFWQKQIQIENLLNKLNVIGKKSQNSFLNLVSNSLFIVTIAYLANCLAGLYSMYRRHILRSMASTVLDYVLPETIFSNTVGNIVSCPLYAILFFLQRMNSVFEILSVATVLSMLALANSFQRQITQDTAPQKLMEKFSGLRETFNLCNEIFGRMFLNYSLVTLFYYVNTPAVLMKMSITLDKLYRLVYLTFHCITFVGACEIHKRIKSTVKEYSYKKKLNESVSQTDLIKLSILAGEVECDPIGISCVLFTMNYAFLASYLGLLGTYAIFTWQMQNMNIQT